VASRANRGQQVNPVLPGRREREALLDRKASPDHREGQKRLRLPFELFVASLQSPANRRRLSSAHIAQALRMKLNLLPSLFRREPRDVPASLTLPWSSPARRCRCTSGEPWRHRFLPDCGRTTETGRPGVRQVSGTNRPKCCLSCRYVRHSYRSNLPVHPTCAQSLPYALADRLGKCPSRSPGNATPCCGRWLPFPHTRYESEVPQEHQTLNDGRQKDAKWVLSRQSSIEDLSSSSAPFAGTLRRGQEPGPGKSRLAGNYSAPQKCVADVRNRADDGGEEGGARENCTPIIACVSTQ
jgi:hypothetical protein